MTSLPASIGKLINLKELNLGANSSTSLPKWIGKLKKLQKLKLGGNSFTSIPTSIGNLTNLEELHLDGNELKQLPKSIGNLINLKIFALKYNELTKLPESFGNLTKLEFLNLGGNKLTKLPESIGNLTKLEELYLSQNQLTSLPESFGNLTKLEFLDLGKNPLTIPPESIKKLKKVIITYKGKTYKNGDEFFKHFYSLNRRVRVSSGTELITNTFSTTNKISNIPPNRRVYINKNSNVKNNGELRRLYNINGITEYMKGRTGGQLHGNKFNMNNVINLKNTNIVNKNVYLGNIRNRLSNVPLNNVMTEVGKIKQNLPSNVSSNDVNVLFRNLKPKILNKIYNKLKNSPSNNRVRIMNNMKTRGIINNTDIGKLKNKLINV